MLPDDLLGHVAILSPFHLQRRIECVCTAFRRAVRAIPDDCVLCALYVAYPSLLAIPHMASATRWRHDKDLVLAYLQTHHVVPPLHFDAVSAASGSRRFTFVISYKRQAALAVTSCTPAFVLDTTESDHVVTAYVDMWGAAPPPRIRFAIENHNRGIDDPLWEDLTLSIFEAGTIRRWIFHEALCYAGSKRPFELCGGRALTQGDLWCVFDPPTLCVTYTGYGCNVTSVDDVVRHFAALPCFATAQRSTRPTCGCIAT